MPVSPGTIPSITNYQIPTGRVWWTDDHALTAGRIQLGNCVEFSITPSITTKDHTRTYGGSRLIDKTIVTLASGTVNFVLDEITQIALGMFSLGNVTDNTGGAGWDIMALTKLNFNGVLEIDGDNVEGPQVDWIGYVNLSPTAALFLIRNNDDWNTVPLQGKIQAHPVHGLGHFTNRALHEGLTA
jgi:hypothetical protein